MYKLLPNMCILQRCIGNFDRVYAGFWEEKKLSEVHSEMKSLWFLRFFGMLITNLKSDNLQL